MATPRARGGDGTGGRGTRARPHRAAGRPRRPEGPPAATRADARSGALAEPLHRSAIHLLRLLRREDDAAGISPARLSALSVLVFGGAATLGALAAAEGVSAPTMSRLVAELEAEGWLRRTADPDDARRARLVATARARKLLLAGKARRLRALGDAIAAITAADRRRLADALPALERLVRALAVPPRAAGSRPKPQRTGKRRFE